MDSAARASVLRRTTWGQPSMVPGPVVAAVDMCVLVWPSQCAGSAPGERGIRLILSISSYVKQYDDAPTKRWWPLSPLARQKGRPGTERCCRLGSAMRAPGHLAMLLRNRSVMRPSARSPVFSCHANSACSHPCPRGSPPVARQIEQLAQHSVGGSGSTTKGPPGLPLTQSSEQPSACPGQKPPAPMVCCRTTQFLCFEYSLVPPCSARPLWQAAP